jgi:hypothetical protein
MELGPRPLQEGAHAAYYGAKSGSPVAGHAMVHEVEVRLRAQ